MLAAALDQLEQQINDRIRANGANPFAGDAVAQDQRRLEALRALRTSWQDPTREASIVTARDAAAKAGVQAANDEYDAASGAARGSAAGRGMLGSSAHRIAQGKATAARDEARTQAVTSAEDLAQQTRQGDENLATAALQQVIAQPSANATLSALTIQQNRQAMHTENLAQSNRDMFRSALANAIGGFVSEAGAGVVNAGFNRANSINNQKEQSWLDGGMNGPRPKRATWSLFD